MGSHFEGNFDNVGQFRKQDDMKRECHKNRNKDREKIRKTRLDIDRMSRIQGDRKTGKPEKKTGIYE